jgi:hypothetical protein
MGPIDEDRWYELGIVVNNDSFWVYWDNMEVLTQEGVNLFGLSNHFGLTDDSSGEATLEIDNWRSWDLGTPPDMRNAWISASVPTVEEDNFNPGEGNVAGGDKQDLKGTALFWQ